MTTSVDVMAVLNSALGDLMAAQVSGFESETSVPELSAAISAVKDAFHALEEAHYGGLMVGEDCAWALANLQRSGVYKPTCSDGAASRADASKDEQFIKKVRQQTSAAIKRFKGA